MKWLLAFLVAGTAVGAEDGCVDWFKESKAVVGTKECFSQCSTHGAGMGTWMCPPRCQEFCARKQKVHYFYGNGMFNTIQDARIAATILSGRLKKELAKHPDLAAFTAPLQVHVSYNSNETAFMQLIQVAYQKASMEESDFFRWLSDLNSAPQWFREAARKLSDFDKEAFKVLDADLRGHLSQYETLLRRGDAILVISHSQGNLYAHAALANFGWQNDLRVVPIASPYFVETSEGLYNGMPYSTLFSDGIIRAIPGSYPPNVANPNSGWFDHSFTKHYLGGANSGPKILNDVMCMTGRYLMRLRPVYLNSYLLESEWDHPTCQAMTPHPTWVRDRAREKKQEATSAK